MTRQDQAGAIGLLANILTDLPKLTGAACIGRPELFDEAHPGEPADELADRHSRAIELCRRCPALDDCAAFAATEKKIPIGTIYAGQVTPVGGSESLRQPRGVATTGGRLLSRAGDECPPGRLSPAADDTDSEGLIA